MYKKIKYEEIESYSIYLAKLFNIMSESAFSEAEKEEAEKKGYIEICLY